MKTRTFYYPYVPGIDAYLLRDTKSNIPLHHFIGETIAHIMINNNDMTDGLQLVRIKKGTSIIIAQKRINDIKITTITYD